MTAGATEEDRRKCLEAGMDECLGKPVRAAAMRRVLEEVSKRRRVSIARMR